MFEPYAWQKQVLALSELHRFITTVVHRQGGKTKLAVTQLVKKATKNKTKLPHYAYIAPLKNQAVQIAWKRLKQELKSLERDGTVYFREHDNTITFRHNNAVIQVFGGSDPDALRGLTLDGIVMDEVAQMNSSVWDEVLQAALAIKAGWALFIGTPKGADLFYDVYCRAFAKDNVDWASQKFTVYETDTIPEKEIARLKREMTPEIFAREFMCDFTIAGDTQLISLEACNEAVKREYEFKDIRDSERRFGIDVARYGKDSSVIAVRQGQELLFYNQYKKLDNVTLAKEIIYQKEKHSPDSIFVDAGGGAGVIDILRNENIDVIEVHFAGKAENNELYQNKRAEMYFRLKDWIEKDAKIPNDLPLINEICTPNYFYNNYNKRQLEKKEDIKARLSNSSPDIADAIALTFAYQDFIAETSYTKYEAEEKRKKELEYNPFDLVENF